MSAFRMKMDISKELLIQKKIENKIFINIVTQLILNKPII